MIVDNHVTFVVDIVRYDLYSASMRIANVFAICIRPALLCQSTHFRLPPAAWGRHCRSSPSSLSQPFDWIRKFFIEKEQEVVIAFSTIWEVFGVVAAAKQHYPGHWKFATYAILSIALCIVGSFQRTRIGLTDLRSLSIGMNSFCWPLPFRVGIENTKQNYIELSGGYLILLGMVKLDYLILPCEIYAYNEIWELPFWTGEQVTLSLSNIIGSLLNSNVCDFA
nr:hypothetical protein Iba_chr01dCG5670 [Ipomoea batatas]